MHPIKLSSSHFTATSQQLLSNKPLQSVHYKTNISRNHKNFSTTLNKLLFFKRLVKLYNRLSIFNLSPTRKTFCSTHKNLPDWKFWTHFLTPSPPISNNSSKNNSFPYVKNFKQKKTLFLDFYIFWKQVNTKAINTLFLWESLVRRSYQHKQTVSHNHIILYLIFREKQFKTITSMFVHLNKMHEHFKYHYHMIR